MAGEGLPNRIQCVVGRRATRKAVRDARGFDEADSRHREPHERLEDLRQPRRRRPHCYVGYLLQSILLIGVQNFGGHSIPCSRKNLSTDVGLAGLEMNPTAPSLSMRAFASGWTSADITMTFGWVRPSFLRA